MRTSTSLLSGFIYNLLVLQTSSTTILTVDTFLPFILTLLSSPGYLVNVVSGVEWMVSRHLGPTGSLNRAYLHCLNSETWKLRCSVTCILQRPLLVL